MASITPPTAGPLAAEGSGRGNALRGITLMLASTLFFAGMHAVIRHVSAELHPFVIAFFRNFFGLIVLLPWFIRHGLEPLRTSRFPLHLARATINAVAMLAFFMALSLAPLTQVTALAFSAPIFATLLAVLFLAESVGPRRWLAILTGFAGALIVLRPGIEAIGTGPALALGASVVWACVLLIIKMLGRTETSVTIAAYMSLLMTPITFVPAIFVWQMPDATQLAWLLGIGIMGGMGQLLMVSALKSADTGIVMPFDFCKLIWVTIIAYFAFHETPDVFTWVGGVVIFASAAYIAYREGR